MYIHRCPAISSNIDNSNIDRLFYVIITENILLYNPCNVNYAFIINRKRLTLRNPASLFYIYLLRNRLRSSCFVVFHVTRRITFE